jgi:hypothetical protein
VAVLMSAAMLADTHEAGAGPGGTGELSLGPAALAELVAPATRRSVPFRLPGFGEASLELGRAERVRLLDGAVEVRVPVTVRPGGLSGGLVVELAPELDRETGRVRLRTMRSRGEGALAGMPDLSRALPVVELPRAFERVVEAGGGGPFRLSAYLQGIDVDPERVLIEFMVKTGPVEAAPADEPEPEREKGAR